MNALLSPANPCALPSGADHRDLIAAYDLGHIEEHSPGLVHWHPHGVRVLHKLESFVRQIHEALGYEEVRSPAMLSRSLWERSGHWDKYQAHMFVVDRGDGDGAYAIKPMSCPGHIGIYAQRPQSYRNLPVRYLEFGQVHRREPSGSLSGWLRLRGFVQDDSHVFLAPEQLSEVVSGFVSMVEKAYSLFGFERWRWRLSLRPDVRAGEDALWDEAESRLRQACQELNLEVEERPGDGAFYGPKLEAVLEDRLGRQWQCGVIQVDFVLPARFGLSYQGADGHNRVPVMVHHAVLGSLERWLSIVLEQHGCLPDWLAPVAVGVCPIGEAQQPQALALVQALRDQGVPARMLANEPLSGRLRDLAGAKVPVWAVIGKREALEGQASVRRCDGKPELVDAAAWARQCGDRLRRRRQVLL